VFQDAILLDWRNILDNVLLQVDIRNFDRSQYEPVAQKAARNHRAWRLREPQTL
jgi:ABC-type nitrate/sulfonate/bicarbonate transport system ATPase subunit